MYNLLIVDDEKSIREGIRRSIQWESWGYRVAGTAADGLQALERVRQGGIDVVLSDIRMPNMDGVALMQALNREFPRVKIIILSGYSDFEYLNMSIKNNVAEYLLKPTDIEEFEQVFARIRARLDDENQQQQRLEALLDENEKSREYRHTEWLNLYLRAFVEEEATEDMQAELEACCGYRFDNCVVLLLTPDGRLGDEDKDLFRLKSEIVAAANAVPRGYGGGFFLSYENTITGLLCLPAEFDLEERDIATYVEGLQAGVLKACGNTVSVGISRLCTEASMLPQCYEQARCCARQNIFLGPGSRVFYSVLREEIGYRAVHINVAEVTAALLAGDYDALAAELARAFGAFSNKALKDYTYVDQMCTEAMLALARWVLQYNIVLEEVLTSLGAGYADIERCDSLEMKRQFMLALLCALAHRLHQGRAAAPRGGSVAYQVKQCVDREYTTNMMSLEYVAEKLNKNPAYISKVFKNELHCNFSDYLLRKRLEKGQELLRDPALKVYQVAEAVGYADTSNFIRVFRKHVGQSPNEYRRGLLEAGA